MEVTLRFYVPDDFIRGLMEMAEVESTNASDEQITESLQIFLNNTLRGNPDDLLAMLEPSDAKYILDFAEELD